MLSVCTSLCVSRTWSYNSRRASTVTCVHADVARSRFLARAGGAGGGAVGAALPPPSPLLRSRAAHRSAKLAPSAPTGSPSTESMNSAGFSCSGVGQPCAAK